LGISDYAVSKSAGFPTTGILDNFNRANGTIGTKWSIDRSGFTISNNRVNYVTGDMIFWNPTSFGANQEAYVTLANVDTTAPNMDLLIKSQESKSKTSFLEVGYNPSKQVISVVSYQSGKGYTTYCNKIPASFSNGDQFGARATADGKVSVFKNGTSLATCDVTAWPNYASGGYIGFLAWHAPNAAFDDFGGGTIGASVMVVPTGTTRPLPSATSTVANTATTTQTPAIIAPPPATDTPAPTALTTDTPAVTAEITSVPTAAMTETSAPTTVPTNPPAPSATSVPPIPTNPPVPSATSMPPTATNTFVPLATSTNPPTATRTATSVPSATTMPTFTSVPTQPATATATTAPVINPGAFTFGSMGDGQAMATNFAGTAKQLSSLNPRFVLFNGDLEDNGVTSSEIDPMIAGLKNAGLFNQTFLIRGNHDNHVSGSAALWESYFETSPNIRILPAGVTDYVSLSSSTDKLNYSFIYGNSMFIGLDVPGAVNLLTSTQLTFMDARLSNAESRGLVHAFIFWHGPMYCVESTHCTCTAKADGSCTPAALVSVINKHPIISAFFHGHEHILGWTHMDNTRVSGLTGSFEEILTSPSGGWTYNSYLFPARMDYTYMSMGTSQAFGAITVNGSSFTVNLYKVGLSAPVWTKTFTKGGVPAPSNTPLPTPMSILTGPTATKTPAVAGPIASMTPTRAATAVPPTSTPQIAATPTNPPAATITPASTPAAGTRVQKYYMMDRVRSNADFAQLAAWGINTAMVDFNVNGSATTWRGVFTEAAKYNINIVIWPSDWNAPRANCGWEAPYPVSAGGDITKVKPLLDVATQYSNFIGILNGHESFWTCTNMTFDEMAGLKTQLKAYALSKGRDIKVWNYINGLYYESMFPASQVSRVMDVAVIWKHCAGNAEGYCDYGTNSALAQINNDRNRINTLGLDGKVELVYIIQTFTSSGVYATKFTLPQLANYSCEFLNTSALDGFGYYTWDAGWWPDLHSWTDLQPAVPYVHDNCLHSAP
jgi:hypothetical protein